MVPNGAIPVNIRPTTKLRITIRVILALQAPRVRVAVILIRAMMLDIRKVWSNTLEKTATRVSTVLELTPKTRKLTTAPMAFEKMLIVDPPRSRRLMRVTMFTTMVALSSRTRTVPITVASSLVRSDAGRIHLDRNSKTSVRFIIYLTRWAASQPSNRRKGTSGGATHLVRLVS